MKSRLKGLFCLIVFNFAIVLFSFAQSGKIAAMPQKLTVHQGQEFDLLMYVHPGTEPVSVVDLFLTFDTLFVKAVSINKINSPLRANQIEPNINYEKGILSYAAFTLDSPPDTPFQLVSVRFKAVNETPNTRIYHDLKAVLKSVLAYAGKDNLVFAPDIEITVLPGIENVASSKVSGKNNLNMNQQKENTLHIDFSVQELGSTKLRLINEKDKNEYVLLDNLAAPEMSYTLMVDTSVLPSGNYQLQLETNGTETTQGFEVSN